MPERLTTVTQREARTAVLAQVPWLRVVTIVAAFVVAGVVGGVVLARTSTPPEGLAYQGEWFPARPGPDLMFAATVHYLAIAAGLGLLLGLVFAFWRAHEWTTLVTTGLAALAAGWILHAVAVAQGPDDPGPAAQAAADLTPIVGELAVAAPGESRHIFLSTASFAMPVGALTGLAGVYLLAGRTSRGRRMREPGAHAG